MADYTLFYTPFVIYKSPKSRKILYSTVRPLNAPQVVKIEQLASFLGVQPPSYQDIDEGSQFTL